MDRSGKVLRTVTTGMTLAAFGACSTTASIKRVDGPDNIAIIERSNEKELVVRGSNGQLYRLAQESVAEIDHPGNVLMTVGGTLIALFAATYFAADPSQRDRFVKAGTPVYVVPGVGLLAAGGYTYFRSTSAADAFESAPVLAQTVHTARPALPVVAAPPAEVVPPPPAPPLTIPTSAAEPAAVFQPLSPATAPGPPPPAPAATTEESP